jgi:hypothetical protein
LAVRAAKRQKLVASDRGDGAGRETREPMGLNARITLHVSHTSHVKLQGGFLTACRVAALRPMYGHARAFEWENKISERMC